MAFEDNSGFLQVAPSVRRRNQPLDAGAFSGIRLTATGYGETYCVHLGTGRTRMMWQDYQPAFQADREWCAIDIPFTAFRPENLRAAPDSSRIERIGVVAVRKAFTARVAVARLAFYR